MINAWSLLYDELNGTMDKTYPIENDESNSEDINITTGTGDTIFNVPEDVEIEEVDLNTPITLGGVDEDVLTIDGGDFINFDYSGVDYSGIGYTGSADTSDSYCVDTLNLDFSSSYGVGEDVITFGGEDEKPTPGIKDPSTRKYKEDESIEALKNYISTTYGGHYTSDTNDVQTLDLIESVGDAESFCRSNAIKYLSRYDKKGQAKRDILKALHYSLLLYHFSGQLNETPTRGYETF